MGLSRRAALQVLAGAGAAAAGGPAFARERKQAPADAVGMLYDSTRCIGCKACVVACREANGLEPDTSGIPGGLYDAPTDLNARTKNVIKLCADGPERSFVKSQCMHCIDPACVGACMIGALQKREHGIVTWEAGRCIGCRYCQEVCPFNVPKFEWSKAIPRIVKCEMCSHLLARGEIPACCRVCPREAVIFGKREDLLAAARKRIADHPGRYVEKVYGETDLGGTQVLYLSHLPFEKLGLPELGDEAAPRLAQTVQHGVYQGFVAPAVLYALLAGVMVRNRRSRPGADGEEKRP
jgi:Fe-S-cluster-containing dehydrogenase component